MRFSERMDMVIALLMGQEFHEVQNQKNAGPSERLTGEIEKKLNEKFMAQWKYMEARMDLWVVLNEMNKFIDSCTDDTPTPFGPLIMDILSNPEAISKADNGDSGPYQIATNEKDHGRFPKMNETQWKKSLGRIQESRANCGLPNPPLPDEVAGAEEEPQDVHRSPPLHAPPPISVPPPPHWSMSYEEYRNMQASHEHLCRRINASELTSARNHYDLVSMFCVFTSQEPLPPFAPPFQEPFLPPNPKEWFRLGHGMSGGGDDFLFNGNES
ncbi:hypothetical protein RHGRI_029817 [Rhododendron griersonianum]|uniref:Uncharacterized protein n=1 Tax=Rhododendron griersonianum TaxID=479676 RepID=A0AAV6IR55_9ERIC|nr:hypothetical protein RHGRI_029817 [Rhododendron griersonianum]